MQSISIALSALNDANSVILSLHLVAKTNGQTTKLGR